MSDPDSEVPGRDDPEVENDFDFEELVFEDLDGPAEGAPRTAPSEAPFFAGQILGGRFEIVAALDESERSRLVLARDRVRGGERTFEVVRRAVLTRIEDLPHRIQTVVPRLKGLSHEAIDPLLDFGLLPDGRPYFASRRLEGTSLAELLERDEPLHSEDAFAVTVRILRALEYGLARDQVHGSLDAHAVLFEAGHQDPAASVRLLGFGRASVLAAEDLRSDSNRDLRAVGPLLAQMLVGRPVQGPLERWWDAHAPALSPAEADVVRTALGSARGGGYGSASQFREAIEALPLLPRTAVSGRRRGWMALAAGALGAAAVWFVGQHVDSRTLTGGPEVRAGLDDVERGSADGRSSAGAPSTDAPAPDADAPDGNEVEERIVDESDPVANGAADPAADPAAEPMGVELVRRIEEQVVRLGEGIDLTNEAVVDLRATTQALGARIDGIDAQLAAWERGQAAAADRDAVALALPRIDGASPELRAAAKALFSGASSPFGPVGARALHHTRTADGEEGWLLVTVGRDEGTPTGADRSWLLEEQYLSVEGRALGRRQVRVVQRGARFEEVDGRIYGLLDLEDPWIELDSEPFVPGAHPAPPERLGVRPGKIERFRLRVGSSATIALVAVDGERRSWFVPGLGFVRYDDPGRIRRELVWLEEH